MTEPDTEFIYSLYNPTYQAQVVQAALLLDVFSPLLYGERRADAVAQACGCDPQGMSHLLDTLAAQIIERIIAALK